MRSHSGRPTPPPQFKKQGRIHCSPSMILCVCFCRPTEQINQCWMNVCTLGWPTPPPRFTSIADVCKAEKPFADGEDRRRVSKQVSTHVKGQFVTGYYLQGPCVFEIPQRRDKSSFENQIRTDFHPMCLFPVLVSVPRPPPIES